METFPREYREIALAWWRQKKLADTQTDGIPDTRRMSREIDRLGRSIEALGIVVRDYTGRPYGNLNVEAVAIEPDSSVESETIFETISPEIVYKGEVVQRSRVVVHKPGSKQSAENEAEKHEERPDIPSSASDQEKKEVATEQEDAVASNAKDGVPASQEKSGLSLTLVLAGISAALCAACLIVLLCFRPTLFERFDRIDSAIQEMDDNLTAREEASVADDNDEEQAYGGEIVLIEYEVKPGDTLFEICESQGIDYDGYVELICRLNGLGSPDSIIAGETLVLPSASEE